RRARTPEDAARAAPSARLIARAEGNRHPASPDSGGEALDRRGAERPDLRPRLLEGVRGRCFAQRQALGIDELDVGHAEEAEDGAQVRHLRVGPGAPVYAAASECHVDLLADDEAL